MKVNGVTSYNNQLQNRKNVKFGDCKKIVCNQYMTKAKEIFEKSEIKTYLDKNYIYEVHFTQDVPHDPMHKKATTYEILLKPASFWKDIGQRFIRKKLPNLPHEIRFPSTSLEDVKLNDSYTIKGLNTIIANLKESDIIAILSQYIK